MSLIAVQLLRGHIAGIQRVLGLDFTMASAISIRSTGTKLSPAFLAIFSASSSTLPVCLVQINLPGVAGHLRDLGQRDIERLATRSGRRRPDRSGCWPALVVIQKGLEQMLGR
jgi:hypothetical protein